MAKLRFRIAISLDGYTAGPEQSVKNPLDRLGAGERLFDGVTDLQRLRPVQTVAAADVTHLKFARGRLSQP